MAYPFAEIEKRWQSYWEEHKTFRTDTSQTGKPKYYVLGMYPYPSGQGLHIGHPESYTAVDILARFMRHKGFEVLNPMGWDAFGLPAEQYAMKTNIHPAITTQENVDNYRRQLKSLGFSYDWDREVNTTDPSYYRWTQWIFIQLFKSWYDVEQKKARPIAELEGLFAEHGSDAVPRPESVTAPDWGFTAEEWREFDEVRRHEVLAEFRLVYEDEFPVNWAPELGSVLANEEVDEWEEKGFKVERRPMRQWMMRITAYADRLLEGHQDLDWPVSTVDMQTNWIGKSYGAEITFETENDRLVKVFTTRPDTLFGATFLTLAPEHPLVDQLVTADREAQVNEYRRAAAAKSDLDRQASEEKTGVFTGSFAVHPYNGERVPIWVGDYVLVNYGTGAVMGVPAHDERDFEFARSFQIPIKPVIEPPEDFEEKSAVLDGEACYSDEGTLLNSGDFDGQTSQKARETIVAGLGSRGRKTVRYKLRDWLFSRQRYWGEPIPLVRYDNGIVEPVPESELPLTLPELEEFKPSGSTESPLALATDWLNVSHPVYGSGRRETNIMPQWAGSCWYYIRYLDPENDERLIDPDVARRWLPVDFYIGGAEHAVTHLLYSRFWHKVLYDLGHLDNDEPFRRLIHQGMILGENSQKMSKSRGNVVNPDDVVRDHGADSLRIFEMFMGPLEMTKPWSSQGIAGVRRFLDRAWRMIVGDEDSEARIESREMSSEEERVLHSTIQKVTEDVESVRLNTAISALMVFVNEFLGAEVKPRSAMETFAVLISPFAPHFAEEAWQRLGHDESIAYVPWPEHDPAKIALDEVEIVLQVNSKIRERIMVPAGASREELEDYALKNATVAEHIAGKDIRKVVAVPDKLVNVIVG